MDNPFDHLTPELRAYFEGGNEDLDRYMKDMAEARSLSWVFNPWWHRLPNFFVEFLTETPTKLIYNDDYIGVDRRETGKIRTLVDSGLNTVRMMMMPKTIKTKPLDEVQ